MVFLVQGRMVREVTSRDSTALHVTMMVLVDIQLGPVNLEIEVSSSEETQSDATKTAHSSSFQSVNISTSN